MAMTMTRVTDGGRVVGRLIVKKSFDFISLVLSFHKLPRTRLLLPNMSCCEKNRQRMFPSQAHIVLFYLEHLTYCRRRHEKVHMKYKY